MITLLTIRLFEALFRAEITGYALGALQVVGFTELIIEVGFVILLIIATIAATISAIGSNDND